jgi:hypothetical protein
MTMPRSPSAHAFVTNAGSSDQGGNANTHSKCSAPQSGRRERPPDLLGQRDDTLRERLREPRKEPRNQSVHSGSERVERERSPEPLLGLGGHDIPQGPRGLGGTNGAATARDRLSTPSACLPSLEHAGSAEGEAPTSMKRRLCSGATL